MSEEYETREGLLYTKDHEWIQIVGENATIGITEYASKEMGDVAFVELPDEGKEMKKGDLLCEIESVKAVSEILAPFSCTVVASNMELEDEPERINDSPYESWIVKVRGDVSAAGLMDAAAYAEYISSMASE